jgi:enolase
MPKILDIFAHKIVNSRGNYTFQTKVTLDNGVEGVSAVPEGASIGKNEAVSFPYDKAIEIVNNSIKELLVGEEIDNQSRLDELMLTMDGSSSKRNLGANSILSVSLACARACSNTKGTPLYFYLSQIFDNSVCFNKNIIDENNFPTPIFNILNGGKHAENELSFQEFMIIPAKKFNYEDSLDVGVTIYGILKNLLKERGLAVGLGDEGGFAPSGLDMYQAFDLLVEASSKKFQVGEDVYFGTDVASNSFHFDGLYYLKELDAKLNGKNLLDMYSTLVDKYPLIYIEDPFEEDDLKSWQRASVLQNKCLISGDDLVVTNTKHLDSALKLGIINSVIVKPNQIGTLTETLDFIRNAKNNNLMTVISHRSGDTAEDSFIADLAVAVASEFIKSGAPARGERVAKYNRILDIYYDIKNI